MAIFIASGVASYGLKISFLLAAPLANAVSAPSAPPDRKMYPCLFNILASLVMNSSTSTGLFREPIPLETKPAQKFSGFIKFVSRL